MLVFGNRYTFIESEISLMKKKFKNINFINYKDHSEEGTLEYLQKLIKETNASFIILNTKAKVPNSLIAFLTKLELEGISYMTLENFMETHLHKCYIDYDNNDLSYLQNIKPYSSWQYFQKRCIDYFGIFWLFFFSWPLMLKIRSKIAKESPGSLLFKQERVGKNGLDFPCTKFRTMHEDSHHDPYTREGDSRIFPYGDIMRRRRYDELPQMINILKGEMHLIGPRAEWNILVKNYENELPYYHERHLVAPGITGWAQVNYPYGQNIEDTRQKLMYDLYYIKNWSLRLELKTVWLTAMTVLGKKGL